MTEYITTKEQCQSLINKYDCVCNQCGGMLEPIETVDNADRPTYWSCCVSCQIYTHGVSHETHTIAKYLVEERNYIPYKHIEQPLKEDAQDYENWKLRQINGACYTVRDVIGKYNEIREKSVKNVQTR